MERAFGLIGAAHHGRQHVAIIAAQLASQHVTGLIGYAIYDATFAIATHQPTAYGQRTDELYEFAAKVDDETDYVANYSAAEWPSSSQ